jgi:hypothetical protein
MDGSHAVAPWTDVEIAVVVDAFRLGKVTGPPRSPEETGWDPGRARCSITTDSGNWFLKKHHPDVVRPETHEIVVAFCAQGGLAPEIVLTTSGESWFITKDWHAEVHKHVEAHPVRMPCDSTAVDAARQTALFHGLLPRDFPVKRSGWYRPGDHATLFEHAFVALRAVGTDTTELARISHRGLATVNRDSVDEWLVHGDLWRGNWLESGGNIVALTDFDWAHCGDRLEDICDVILTFCTDRDTAPGMARSTTGRVVNWDRVGIMLREYERYAPRLTPDEIGQMPPVMESLWIRHQAWLIDQIADCGVPAILLRDDDTVYSCDALDRVLEFPRHIDRTDVTSMLRGLIRD